MCHAANESDKMRLCLGDATIIAEDTFLLKPINAGRNEPSEIVRTIRCNAEAKSPGSFLDVRPEFMNQLLLGHFVSFGFLLDGNRIYLRKQFVNS